DSKSIVREEIAVYENQESGTDWIEGFRALPRVYDVREGGGRGELDPDDPPVAGRRPQLPRYRECLHPRPQRGGSRQGAAGAARGGGAGDEGARADGRGGERG